MCLRKDSLCYFNTCIFPMFFFMFSPCRRRTAGLPISAYVTGLSLYTLRGKLIQRVLPSHNGLRIRSRSVDGVGNKLRIHTLNVRQVVANIVGHEACTAETVLFEPCNIRCFSRHGRGVGNRFLTRKRSAVMNIREDTRCISFQCAAVRTVCPRQQTAIRVR